MVAKGILRCVFVLFLELVWGSNYAWLNLQFLNSMLEHGWPQISVIQTIILSFFWSLLFYEQLKGPVEKGRKWQFEVKIEIAPI